MDGQLLFGLLFGFILLAYLILFLSGKHYLKEYFQGAKDKKQQRADGSAAGAGSSMKPVDTLGMEEEERKVLSAYKAPSAVEMVEYEPSQEAMDPQEIIHNLYNKKGVIPTVKHETGTNVYLITGVRRKDEKVMYEDEEAPAASTPVEGAGEQRISVPAAATDMAAARDPFYDATAPGAGSSTRAGKWDYRGWTPGLERMFAPTEAKQNWY